METTSPRASAARASAMSRASSSLTGSSSMGALARAMETGSSMALKRPTAAITCPVDRRSMSS